MKYEIITLYLRYIVIKRTALVNKFNFLGLFVLCGIPGNNMGICSVLLASVLFMMIPCLRCTIHIIEASENWSVQIVRLLKIDHTSHQ